MAENKSPNDNRPFPSFPKPLFQSEANCEAIDVNMILYSTANKLHFPWKDFACSLERESWKWPVCQIRKEKLEFQNVFLSQYKKKSTSAIELVGQN